MRGKQFQAAYAEESMERDGREKVALAEWTKDKKIVFSP